MGISRLAGSRAPYIIMPAVAMCGWVGGGGMGVRLCGCYVVPYSSSPTSTDYILFTKQVYDESICKNLIEN